MFSLSTNQLSMESGIVNLLTEVNVSSSILITEPTEKRVKFNESDYLSTTAPDMIRLIGSHLTIEHLKNLQLTCKKLNDIFRVQILAYSIHQTRTFERLLLVLNTNNIETTRQIKRLDFRYRLYNNIHECKNELEIKINSESLATILKFFPNLEYIQFDSRLLFSRETFQAFATHNTKLRKIKFPMHEFFSFSDQSACMVLLANKCIELRSIYLGDHQACNKTTGKCIKIVAKHCKHLKKIYLNDCKDLNDQSFKELSKGCQNLQSLQFRNLELSSKSLKTLFKYLLSLKSIDLSVSQRLTDNYFTTIKANQLALEKLNLACCPQLTDRTILHLAKKMPQLKYLNLENSLISDDSLFELAKYCLNLQIIDVSGTKVTSKGLIQLLKNCPSLTDINLDKMSLNDDMINLINYFRQLKEEVNLENGS